MGPAIFLSVSRMAELDVKKISGEMEEKACIPLSPRYTP
jgi:hypothetical protein